MSGAICIIPNCGKSVSASEPFCSAHRDDINPSAAMQREIHAARPFFPRDRLLTRTQGAFDQFRYMSDSQFAELASSDSGEEVLGGLVGLLSDLVEHLSAKAQPS